MEKVPMIIFGAIFVAGLLTVCWAYRKSMRDIDAYMFLALLMGLLKGKN